MKKTKVLAVVLAVCFALSGCSGQGDGKSNAADKPDEVDGYKKVEYSEYGTSPQDDSKLGEKIYDQGTVVETFTANSSSGITLQNDDGNKWVIVFAQSPEKGNEKIKELEGKRVRVQFTYYGILADRGVPFGSLEEGKVVLLDENNAEMKYADFSLTTEEYRSYVTHEGKSITARSYFSSYKDKYIKFTGYMTEKGSINSDGRIYLTLLQKDKDYVKADIPVYFRGGASNEQYKLLVNNAGFTFYGYVDTSGKFYCRSVENKDVKYTMKDYTKSLKGKCKTYSYKKIAREPSKYKGKYAKFKGQVVQVMEGSGKVVLRVNVTKGSYGIYSDTIYVVYDSSITSKRILEKDIVTLYGTLDGLETYTSTLGVQISIPRLQVFQISI